MPGVISPQPLKAIPSPAVLPLRSGDIPALRLPSRRSVDSVRETIEQRPDRSVWIPDTLEYAVIGCWRNRQEISSLDDLTAVRNVTSLIQAAADRSFQLGDELLLAVELESQSSRSRFERAGMELLEEVITYEIDCARIPRMPQKHLRFVSIQPHDYAAIDRVALLDQAAFPWLWRNSLAEFDAYLRTPGVAASFVMKEGEPVAYVGMTIFNGWGHLDRIAVSPRLQGQGYGRAALMLAADAMRRQGARRIGLSTQRTNLRSQKLYEGLGFRRTPDLDYRLFGIWSTLSGRLAN